MNCNFKFGTNLPVPCTAVNRYTDYIPVKKLICVSYCMLISHYCMCFYTELNKNPVEGFSAGLIDDNDIYRWEVLVIGPPDTYL